MSFSSYDPAECAWLLTDLSHVALEVGTEDREELIQGGRHYAEMLPVEYQPDAAYTALFHRALDATAVRLAHAVGLVGDLLLEQARAHGVDPRLGPPRTARQNHGRSVRLAAWAMNIPAGSICS